MAKRRSTLLENFEKDRKREKQKEIANERNAITRWEKAKRGGEQGTPEFNAATAILKRLEKKAHEGKIQAEKRSREQHRMIDWAPRGIGTK